MTGHDEPALFAATQEERERDRAESRKRYHSKVRSVLVALGAQPQWAPGWADAVLDELFVVTPHEGGAPCPCSCHPKLPEGDLHDHGFACPCLQTAAERRASWQAWTAEIDAYWDSADGQEVIARRKADEAALDAWLAGQPGVVVDSHGGFAPEQWTGAVDGHSFYFRERHDSWRIELDLRPTGRQHKVLAGGAPELREIERGDVIAEGAISAPGYGETAVDRARFIVRLIRDHLGREGCRVHAAGRAPLESRLGTVVRWCPGCGERLA